ncbi:hypothetical protein U0C82_07645 [Fulvimarina sp. 2208YS6-2-32]|uniref:Hint domain-containing protein n=1 Tax=Fulvimarina uroteuthidis TaxID=3098149 RepID=A0ABU5I1Q1_9HYPH|nr:hypothetical protein [Fulvimarina sp. 2208YS6-2-32]MDY8109015.1 hypothetical protein [Fulvimarina sp. 2208YS6-2-32]
MPLQNRILPTGAIVAHPSKEGLFMGNRGMLHDAATRTLGRRLWQHRHWVVCVTERKGRTRSIMAKGQYTELFFLDDAVALAAGHRPCGACRHADLKAYAAALSQGAEKAPAAAEIDVALHRARVDPLSCAQITMRADARTLPDGAYILVEGMPWLVLGDRILRYTPAGYDAARARPGSIVTVLTPGPSIDALRGGFVPVLHPTAAGARIRSAVRLS